MRLTAASIRPVLGIVTRGGVVAILALVLFLPSSVHIFLATDPVDLRKGFNALAALVHGRFQRHLLDGHLFVFVNRRADQMRVLFWDGSGLCFLAKRLEKGSFRLSRDSDGKTHCEIDSAEFLLLLEGFDLAKVKRPARWQPPAESLPSCA